MRLRLLLVAAFVLPVSLCAADLPAAKVDALRSKFEARQRATDKWAARFTQTLALPGLKSPSISEGVISYRAPDMLRIDFTKPAGEFVLINGDDLYVQKTGKKLSEKSLSRDNAGRPFEPLLFLLQGRRPPGHESFEPTVTEEGERYVVVFTRKQGASSRLPKRVTNLIASTSLDLQGLFVDLPNGGTLRYSFSNIDRNPSLKGVSFDPPKER